MGSGLGELADEYCDLAIPYSEIPGFEASTVSGHKGRLVFAEINGKNVVMMQGRFHYYEGHTIQKVVYPVKVMKKLGVKTLIITNAAGGVNPAFNPSDLMVITDHINFMGVNPLVGENDNERTIRLHTGFRSKEHARGNDGVAICKCFPIVVRHVVERTMY